MNRSKGLPRRERLLRSDWLEGRNPDRFKNGLVEDGEAWMDMIKARNLTSHTYDCEVAESIARDVLTRFEPALAALDSRFQKLAEMEES